MQTYRILFTNEDGDITIDFIESDKSAIIAERLVSKI